MVAATQRRKYRNNFEITDYDSSLGNRIDDERRTTFVRWLIFSMVRTSPTLMDGQYDLGLRFFRLRHRETFILIAGAAGLEDWI
ncbi:hypothetical protein NPIL_121641 [Nephila pilipes]|uniref:Uncharacterized protein n=1 Tax=Nephila pilipes TaxID=299642 RepID=A0A8X6M6Z8_NEPPI|nr:hypothetical protein NPIL_121641 [Nephila pilipes]